MDLGALLEWTGWFLIWFVTGAFLDFVTKEMANDVAKNKRGAWMARLLVALFWIGFALAIAGKSI